MGSGRCVDKVRSVAMPMKIMVAKLKRNVTQAASNAIAITDAIKLSHNPHTHTRFPAHFEIHVLVRLCIRGISVC